MTKTPQVEVGVELPRAAPDATVSAFKEKRKCDTRPWFLHAFPDESDILACSGMVMLMQLLIAAKARSPHKKIRQQSFSLLGAH